MREYGFHQVADAFRILSQPELDAMADDIKRNGQRTPVTLCDGLILDGRNRALACELAGVDVWTQIYDGDKSLDGLVAYVKSMNDSRRHDTPSQRAFAGAKMAKLFDAEAKERQTDGGLASIEAKGKSSAKAADASGSSRSSVNRAAKVIREAPDSVVLAVESGKMSLNAAVKKLPKPNKPASGKPKVDFRDFDKLEGHVKAIARGVDNLAKKVSGDKFARDIHAAMETVFSRLKEWKRAGRPL